MNIPVRPLSTAALAFSLVCTGFAQTPPPTPAPAPAQAPKTAPAQTPPTAPPPKPNGLKPYKDVITEAARTQEGVFKVHRIEDKVYWEIPAKLYGRDFLWQAEMSEIPASVGYVGQNAGTRVIRFERRNNRLQILLPNYSIKSEEKGGVETGVNAANPIPIIMSVPIETESESKSVVIDVTNWFLADQSDFAVGPRIGAFGVDQNRSQILRVNAFPNNIETRAALTFLGIGARPSATGRPTGGQAVTATVHSSLNLLPEKPMMGRLFDSRVGFFFDDFDVYGGPKKRVESKGYISRFRLEKQDPSKEVSDPVKPITFYLAREVPDKWRPYMKKAVESWAPAFEQAGFSNAIKCVDAPSKKDDPTWDPEDSRYSVIRWAPSPIANAMGPHVADPRSGETINAHVIFWHNVQGLVQDWYFGQCAAVDPRAKSMPLPDDLLGELVGYVVAHEVGHTLGLMHNFKASSSVSIAQLRNPQFVKENGVSASIMDYSRFNYVTQPGDGAGTMGRVGPYDKFAIEWGYKPIASATSPEDEVSTLDLWAAKQVTEKKFRFKGDIAAFMGVDPSSQTEDIGDDAVEATRLGILNLRKIAKMLPTATVKFGEDYDALGDGLNTLVGQWAREMFHVTTNVGGIVETDYHGGRGVANFVPVPAAKQRRAVKFLLDNLYTPDEFLNPQILDRVEGVSAARVSTILASLVLNRLMSDGRVNRMMDNELKYKDAYTASAMVGDIQSSIFGSVQGSSINLKQRAVQRAYVDLLDDRLNGAVPTKSDFRPVLLGSALELTKLIDSSLPKASDRMTKLHLMDLKRQLDKVINPRKDSSAARSGLFMMLSDGAVAPSTCWSNDFNEAIGKLIREK